MDDSTSTEPLVFEPPAFEPLALRFLREAPHLANARDLGLATCPVEPWPHQRRVVRTAVDRYPESFLFADEVGLGKTIEAGLALRQLVISGRVSRALLLVPKGLLRQWQEELHEKLVLTVPRYEGGRLLDVFDREIAREPSDASPWDRASLVLASTQMARRKERRAELLAARPWDLIIVDEAHHARRRGLGRDHLLGGPRPNRLLELLAGHGGSAGLVHHTRCLYLLTATPMQVHPLEVWDLLRLLGLGGRWGGRGDEFLRYFDTLRQPFDGRDWPFLLDMLDDVPGPAPTLPHGAETLHADDRRRLETLLRSDVALERRQTAIHGLPEDGRQVLDRLLQHHTPMRHFAFRGTRDLLRAYRRRGLLDSPVPERRPQNVWIDLRPEELALYRRIEVMISELYRRYEAQRRGLGFIMTVYRRRLTSSFYAVGRSLERRLAWLEGHEAGLFADEDRLEENSTGGEFDAETSTDDGGTDDEPLASTNLWQDPSLDAAAPSEVPEEFDERAAIVEFLGDLSRLGTDSKLERLHRDLEKLLPRWGKVLVFTQYTDTMDFLRRELHDRHGAAVACFSGRGGEVWRDGWQPMPKEQLKEAFRHGEAIRILLCTEAAGEGLNLQTCGVLINFDMPWNPMRVEQRIGRIDRIGQVHGEVQILNYFYRDTVEAVIYERLSDRIAWFEQVVGTLQPILHRIGDSIRRIALTSGDAQRRALDAELEALEQALDDQTQPLNFGGDNLSPEELDAIDLALLDRSSVAPADDRAADEGKAHPPITAEQIETFFTQAGTLGERFVPRPEEPGVWDLQPDGQGVTFRPSIFDRKPQSLRLLTWGEPLFHALLHSLDDRPDCQPERDTPTGVGLYRTAEPQPVSLFFVPTPEGLRTVDRFEELQPLIDGGQALGRWRSADEAEATSRFSSDRREALGHRLTVEGGRRLAEGRALVAGARRVLRQAALTELAQASNPGLFDAPLPHGFGAEAVPALARHGEPFPALLAAAGDSLMAHPEDPDYADWVGRAPGRLTRRWNALREEGEAIVRRLAALEAAGRAAEMVLREPSASGVLERLWFPLGAGMARPSADEPFERVTADSLRPFRNAIPLYGDLDDLAQRVGDSETWGTHPQRDAMEHPGNYEWVAPGRRTPERDLCVVPVSLKALDRRFGDHGWGLFRLAPRNPRTGALVFALHHGISDPELGSPWTLRTYAMEPGQLTADGDWRPPRVMLGPLSTDPTFEAMELEDLEEGSLQLIAELVEVL